MFRIQTTRISKSGSLAPLTHRLALRSYSTPPPPHSGQPAPKPKNAGSNTLLYSVLGVAAATGAYYYFANPQEVEAAKEKARREQQELEQKARDSVHAGKARADDAYKQGLAKYDAAKTSGKDKIHEIEERARSAGSDAQGKLERTLSDTRDSAENLYKEARSTADRKVSEGQSQGGKAAEDVKTGWFSWLSWGKSKAEDKKQEAVGKVVESAEDVKSRAEKHTET